VVVLNTGHGTMQVSWMAPCLFPEYLMFSWATIH
jgi:hypothetical protein